MNSVSQDTVPGTCPSTPVLDDQRAAELYPHVFRICRAICAHDLNPLTEAEEVTQAVFVKILSTKSPFEGRNHAKFMTWVSRIAYRERIVRLRERKTKFRDPSRAVLIEDPPSDEDPEIPPPYPRISLPDPNAPFEEKVDARMVSVRILDCLSTEHRTLLVLKAYEGLSLDELVAITGQNTNTLRVKLFRAKQKIIRRYMAAL